MNMKRALMAAAGFLLLSAAASAEMLPLAINFQGKLIDPSTNNPRNGTALMTFNLYNVAAGGASLWTESQDGVVLTNGVFSLTIGTNTALSRDLFLGASAYLEVTVVSVNGVADGVVMTPRQRLVMSPYAFTANQLSDNTEVRLISGITYSTFTSAGNLSVPGGVSGSSGSFTNGVTASSGTFLASGPNQYSITTSSGINMNAGMLDATGSSGILAPDSGIIAGTGTFTAWLTASSVTVTATGGAYDLTVTSGILLNQGTLAVKGGGGITNQYGLQSSSAAFTATGATWTVVASSSILIASGELQIGPSLVRTMSDDAANSATVFSSNVEIVGNLTAADFNWIFLASGTMGVAATSLSVPVPNANIPAADVVNLNDIRLIISVPGLMSNTAVWALQFNADAGNHYATIVSEATNAAGTGTNTVAFIELGSALNTDGGYCSVQGAVLTNPKSFVFHCNRNTNVATANPVSITGAGVWANAATAITNVTLTTVVGTRTFPVGTSVRVFGAK